MKILQIVDEFGHNGGLERFVYNFSEALLEKGWDTVVAARGVEQEHGWGKTRIVTETVAGEQDALRLAGRYGPDLVIWHAGGESSDMVLALAASYPVYSTVHSVICPSGTRLFRDSDQICFKKAGPGCFINWYAHKCGTSVSPMEAIKAIDKQQRLVRALKACKLVYAVSDAVTKFLVIEGVSASRIRVFDNTLNGIEHMIPLEQPKGGKTIRLLSVGRLVYSKGIQYMLKAIPLLLAKGYTVEYTVVGDGWYRGALETTASKLEIADAVRFTGRIPGNQINEWYRSCDVVIVPSIWPDPAPLVVPEARLLGKPVVVFEAGGLPEWADFMDGVSVAEHANHESLADTIQLIVEQKQGASAAAFVPRRKRENIIEHISGLCS